MVSPDLATLGDWALVAFQESPDPIALTRLAGGVMVAVNPAFLRRIGLPEEKVLGRTTDELGLWRDPGVRNRIVDCLRRDGVVRDLEIDGNPPDGSRVVFAFTARVVDVGGVPHVLSISRDITERKRLEEQVRQAQKLDSIGRLAGGIAHDFNNILTAILSSAEALKEGLGGRDAESARELEQILAAGWRARDLTRQLLAFARKQVIAPVLLDLNQVIRSSETLFQRVLGEDVRMETELAPDLWPVLCDRGQVDQVLMNLVVNARDAMPTGGSLVVRTANVPGAASAGAAGDGRDRVRLVVQDSGTGISPEVRAHLFEPFFTTKPPGRGTGLGLATVYGIVTQSGGDVRVQSEPGGGTSLALSLPRAAGAAAHPPRDDPAPARRSSGHECLLVVEDDERVRAVAVRALSESGYRVLVAEDGAAALEVVRREGHGIEMVVTDVVMPGLSGRAVVDALRVGLPGLKALYVSGYSGEEIAERGVLDAGVHFLQKPFTPAMLVERVRAILDGG